MTERPDETHESRLQAKNMAFLAELLRKVERLGERYGVDILCIAKVRGDALEALPCGLSWPNDLTVTLRMLKTAELQLADELKRQQAAAQ